MRSSQSSSLAVTCTQCGQASTITIVTTADMADYPLNCAGCGVRLGTVGEHLVETPEPSGKRRARSLDYLERHSSAVAVRPYLRQISGWQERSAHLRALLATGRLEPRQSYSARFELGRMREELRTTLATIRSRNARLGGRVKDVVLSLDRLDQQLTAAALR